MDTVFKTTATTVTLELFSHPSSVPHLPVLYSVDGTTFRNEAAHRQRLLQGVLHSHSAASRYLNTTIANEHADGATIS